MPSRPSFTMRLRAYSPLAGPGAIIPDLGFEIVSGPDGGTLRGQLSTVVYGALPDHLEVAVEVWSDALGAWTEGRDSRFIIHGQDSDDRDRTGMVDIVGIGLPQFLALKAALAGVTPYQNAGSVEAAASNTAVRVSGSTFTWGSHILGVGDRVRIVKKGHSKGLSSGSVYYVRNPTASTFQLSHTPTGAIKSYGSASDVSMERVRTRIVLGAHKFAKNQAVSVFDAGGSNLTNGSQYYVVNPTATSIQVASKPGGIPIELAANQLTVYRYLDGARQFKNQTAGDILETAFFEARDRGWGQDDTGSDAVFHSWSAAGDSNSLAWPARVDDPSITGVSIGFQPGTSLWAMVQFMVENGWAEFASHGRTFDLFAPNTGTDYGLDGSTGQNQRRIGTVAQQVRISKDLTDYRTAEIVRGTGPVEKTVTASRSPWGRLEVYTTAAGVGSSAHALSYGRGDLAKYAKPAVGYQVVEAAQEAAYLPILDYQRGDWVMVQVKGAWTRLRVTQWTFAKATDGTATVTVLLENKKRSHLHKVAHAAHRAHGGRAATTTSTTPHESDKRKAAKPKSLAVTARTTYSADKSAKGTIKASWLPVTSDEDGNDLVAQHYEVHVRPDGEQHGKTLAVTKHTTVDLHGFHAGHTVAVAVRAQSDTGEWGELSDEVEYVVDSPEDAPQAPSTPVVVSTLGSVTITWDGMLLDPTDGAQAPAAGFGYVAIQRSKDNGSTWATQAQTLHAAGTVTDLGLTVGAAYLYRLLAFDVMNAPSTPSATASVTVVGIDVAQINAGFKKSMDDVAAVSSNAQQVANQSAATAGQALTTANSASTAAGQAQTTASNALTAANGKSKVTYSVSAVTGNGISQGDLWFQVDASGRIIGQWSWVVTNGTGAWQVNQITGQVLTNLDAGTITTGFLDAARISARSISASQIAVADFTNLFPSPHFNAVGGGTWFNVALYGGTDVPIGNAITVNSRDTISTAVFRIKGGDSFYIEATVKNLTGTASITPTLWITNASGNAGSNWNSYDLAGMTQFVGAVGNPGGGWARYGYKVTIPAAWSDASLGALYLQINQSGTDHSTSWAVADVLIRRAANAALIIDGSVTANSIAAGAIDGKVITGGTIRTASTATTSGGVILDPTGITGYNASGAATFRVDTNGQLTATGATITGQIAGGSLNVASGGSITAGNTGLSTAGLVFADGGTVSTNIGAIGGRSSVDATAKKFYGLAFVGDNSGSIASQVGYVGLSADKSDMTVRGPNGLHLLGYYSSAAANPNSYAADLRLTNDGSPRVSSQAILYRTYATAATTPNSTDNQLVVITSSGTLGTLSNATLYMKSVYNDALSGRSVVVDQYGHLGYTSSARRTKNLHGKLKMDDTALDAWMSVPTWRYDYKADDAHKEQIGVVAEEMLEAGFQDLVYFDERPGDTYGDVDGFAYEKMGVYNRMAMRRLYERLQDAEARLARLEVAP